MPLISEYGQSRHNGLYEHTASGAKYANEIDAKCSNTKERNTKKAANKVADYCCMGRSVNTFHIVLCGGYAFIPDDNSFGHREPNIAAMAT